jgi:DNA polymerase I
MDKLIVPNMRRMFVPDLGHLMFEIDLKGADAQVVAWDAGDEDLKDAFRKGLDVHAKNAGDMLGDKFTQLSPDDPARKALRQDQKRAVHATNYLSTPRNLAAACGWTVYEAERWQRRWFSLHPMIKLWHKRIEADLATTRTIKNAFGYRIIFFDRLDQCLTNAVAWIPQSSVAINCFRGALNVRRAQLAGQFDPDLQFLIQVHDSWLGQVPLNKTYLLRQMHEFIKVTTPYPDPLIIPWDLKTSTKSWGDCKETKWETLPLVA